MPQRAPGSTWTSPPFQTTSHPELPRYRDADARLAAHQSLLSKLSLHLTCAHRTTFVTRRALWQAWITQTCGRPRLRRTFPAECAKLTRVTLAQICPLLNAYYVDSHFILALPFYPFTLRTLLDNPSFRPEINGSEPQDESDSFEVVSKAIIAQMCAAVAYLEEEGIAHRDISPSNWLLDTSGRAVLTDFGTVWLAGSAEGAHQAPLDFELGTGGYRAPELLFGSRSYDPVCIDRWALGCCIAEFFTPFAADEAGMDSDEDSDNIDSGIASPWDAIGRESRGPKSSAGNAPPRPAWMGPAASARRPKPLHKAALFDGGWSDFALIGSIFKTLGTPNLETWPVSLASPYRQK